MCIYESGPGSPENDGLPFAVALFSWSTRMLSYSEPSLHQKTRALWLGPKSQWFPVVGDSHEPDTSGFIFPI